MSNKETVFHTEWFAVERETFDHVQSLRGKPFYRITSADGVIVLATTGTGEFILVRQYRPALAQATLELSSGRVDAAESPEAAAARELHEETGYVCKGLSPVGVGRVEMGRAASREYAFFGTGALRDTGFGNREELEAVLVSPADFRALVLSGQFQQWSGLATLLLTEWKLGRSFWKPA